MYKNTVPYMFYLQNECFMKSPASCENMTSVSRYAPDVYNALNGVFCAFKPEGRSIRHVFATIKTRLQRGTCKRTQLKCIRDYFLSFVKE